MVKKVQRGKQQQRKSKAKKRAIKPAKIFIYALALAALGGGGYLLYEKAQRRRKSVSANASDSIVINNNLPAFTASLSSGTRTTTTASDNFPLKRGSRGTRVMLVQQALAKTNPNVKPDGIFGPITASALKAAGYPEVIDEATFTKITGASSSAIQVIFNPNDIASRLYKAAQGKNLDLVLSILKEIKSVQDYSAVNEYYKKQSFFISRTIVTDLLDYAFRSDEPAKELIRKEFLRMGLKLSTSGTWTLQGIRLFKDIITIRATVVTDSYNNKIPVRKNTILGDEIKVANGMTWFKSIDNTILQVPTQDIKYT